MYHTFFLVVVLVSATDGHRKYSRNSRWYESEASCRTSCIYPGTVCVEEGSRWCCTKADACKAPQAPEHGKVYTPCGTGHGRMAAYVCDKGYEVVGGPSLRTCEAGEWSGTEPVCIKDCGELDDPENGDVILDGTLEGDTATYVCDMGFRPSHVNGPRTCVSGGWSGLPVVCLPVICSAPGNPENGEVTIPSPLEFETAVVYACEPGFELIGPNTRYCLSNGSLSESAPTCSKDCGLPDPICNGEVDVPSTLLDSTVTYYCGPDFNLVGNETRTCTASGWSGDPPCCVVAPFVTCPRLFDPELGDVDVTGNVVGSTATYECIECLSLTNSTPRVCQPDGTWSGFDRFCTFAAGEDWWIGLSDEETENDFRWFDDSTDASYDNWAGGAGQPDNSDGDEDCAILRESQGYTWWDVDCSNEYNFICYIPL